MNYIYSTYDYGDLETEDDDKGDGNNYYYIFS